MWTPYPLQQTYYPTPLSYPPQPIRIKVFLPHTRPSSLIICLTPRRISRVYSFHEADSKDSDRVYPSAYHVLRYAHDVDGLDLELLRIAFVVYGAMNRKDWRTVSVEDVGFDAAELARQLVPTLRSSAIQESELKRNFGEV